MLTSFATLSTKMLGSLSPFDVGHDELALGSCTGTVRADLHGPDNVVRSAVEREYARDLEIGIASGRERSLIGEGRISPFGKVSRIPYL
jgi:hypothetical protein